MNRLTHYFLVLDIETSTLFEDEKNLRGQTVKQPKAVWLSYGFCKLYDTNNKCYEKCYFREWFDLMLFFDRICSKFYGYKIICYVHNLSYEFDFLLKNISMPKNIISNSTHEPISTILEEYPQIEFRCTYKLTGYSLRKIGEFIGMEKLESEYRTIYPNDEITKQEIEYCERDCDIVAKYICDISLKEYKRLFDIPLTKTGRVRKVYNDFYNKLCKNPDWDLLPTEKCYNAELEAFSGGITISNPLFTDILLHNVHSYDITSSYPYAMLKEYFPYTIEEGNTNDFGSDIFYIAKIRFNNIKSKYAWSWLSKNKMIDYCLDTSIFFNGKVISSNYITRTVTNIDFDMINKTYYFDSFDVLEYYPCKKYGKIPKPYIETIKIFSEKKYKLKNELQEIEKIFGEFSEEYINTDRDYSLAKNDFNSIYGMTVQKLTNPDYIVDKNFVWSEKEKKYSYIPNKHIKRNFLFGLYVTAYARKNLLTAIIKNCPLTFVYADTDSIKFIGENVFIDTNEKLPEEYISIKSLSKLGTFCYEKTYDDFKTFGAKKYCYRHNNDIVMTVAGLPKNVNPLNSVNDFVCGLEFPNCKLGKKYINNQNQFDIELDENSFPIVENFKEINVEKFYLSNNIISNGGVALYPTSYKLDMTHGDKFIVKEHRRILKLWVENYRQQTGINLTEYLNI